MLRRDKERRIARVKLYLSLGKIACACGCLSTRKSVAVVIISLCCALPKAAAVEEQWFATFQNPPEGVQPLTEALRPLLLDRSGDQITSWQHWLTERSWIESQWRDFLGPINVNPPPHTYSVVSSDMIDGCSRELIRYESEPGETVEAYLLWPAHSKTREPLLRHPAIVVFHATNRTSIEEVAGFNGNPNDQLGLFFAKRGYVVICPRCFLWSMSPEHVLDVKQPVADFHKRHPGAIGMHKMLYDAMRAVDVISAIAGVDSENIGAVGHSLGAKETLYLSAFDPRVKAAVASEGGIGLTFTNWSDPWYLGSAVKEPQFLRNHHELLAMIAPRGILVVAGESGAGAADGDRSWPYVESAIAVSRLNKNKARIGFFNHRQGHSLPSEALEKMSLFFDACLKP